MMLRACLTLILGILIATISSAFAPAPVYREPSKPKRGELLAALQGTWNVPWNSENISTVRRGGAIIRLTEQIRIQGTSWTSIYTDNGIEVDGYNGVKYQIILDPKAGPATLDLKQEKQNVAVGVPIPGERVGEVAMNGIVKVDGDTLTYCYVNGHNENAGRPTQFSYVNEQMPDGIRAITMTLKKVD